MTEQTDPLHHRGSARTTIVAMCCPACTATDVSRTHWQAGWAMAWWQCGACAHRWKEDHRVGRAKAAVP